MPAYKFKFTDELIEDCTKKPRPAALYTVLNYPLYDEMTQALLDDLDMNAASETAPYTTHGPTGQLYSLCFV